LTAGDVGLVVVPEPTLDKAFDKAVTHAVRTVKRSMDTTADELIAELKS